MPRASEVLQDILEIERAVPELQTACENALAPLDSAINAFQKAARSKAASSAMNEFAMHLELLRAMLQTTIDVCATVDDEASR